MGGSVIVAGTSYGGTTSGFDYFVIKYDSGGNTVWPNSGSAGTSAVYHNGAIRSTQSSGTVIHEGLITPTSDSKLVLVIKDDPDLYVAGNGTFEIRLAYTELGGETENWTVSIDQLTVDFLHQ